MTSPGGCAEKMKLSDPEPKPRDVLLGRGTNINEHAGNVRFRQLITAKKDHYKSLTRNHDKDRLAREVGSAVIASGGRFLKKKAGIPQRKSNAWEVVKNEQLVLLKVKQAMRDVHRSEKVKNSSRIAEVSVLGKHSDADVEIIRKAVLCQHTTPDTTQMNTEELSGHARTQPTQAASLQHVMSAPLGEPIPHPTIGSVSSHTQSISALLCRAKLKQLATAAPSLPNDSHILQSHFAELQAARITADSKYRLLSAGRLWNQHMRKDQPYIDALLDQRHLDAVLACQGPHQLNTVLVRQDQHHLDTFLARQDQHQGSACQDQQRVDAVLDRQDQQHVDAVLDRQDQLHLDTALARQDQQHLGAVLDRQDQQYLDTVLARQDQQHLGAVLDRQYQHYLDAVLARQDQQHLDTVFARQDPRHLDAVLARQRHELQSLHNLVQQRRKQLERVLPAHDPGGKESNALLEY